MADTRARMVEATITALQRHGVAGMSFTEVLEASGAARGAIYHHFPQGKAQLAREAAQLNAGQVSERLTALPAGSPGTVVQAFLAAIRPAVAASAEGGGCAVAAVTIDAGLDTSQSRQLCEVAAVAFAAWSEHLAERLIIAGLDADSAHDLATTLITLLEGAHVLCRAAGNLEPFDRVARTALRLTDAIATPSA